MTIVYVVKSGGCADRDHVYGVCSTRAAAERLRLSNLPDYNRNHWPDSVEVEEHEVDAAPLGEEPPE
jgi:hypothetical protein